MRSTRPSSFFGTSISKPTWRSLWLKVTLPVLSSRESSAMVRAGRMRPAEAAAPLRASSDLASRRPSVATTFSLSASNSKNTPLRM